ncbi:hypothetical protein HDV06_005830 [Boothiomyces sp. JEL0866]|nr:hypothetical protein HDV06_005830 [Boothiomyces sp. JEL0866]
MEDPTLAAMRAEGTIILDDYLKTPKSRTGSFGEILTLFSDLYNTPDPTIQIFILFFVVFLGIPFVGGCILLIMKFFKVDTVRPPRAHSWVPIFGTFIQFSADPIGFLQRQFLKKGKVFLIDIVLTETVCAYGEESIVEASDKKSPFSHSLYYADQLGPLMTKGYRLKIQQFMDIAQEYFKKFDAVSSMSNELKQFLTIKLEPYLNNPSMDLFAVSSSLYFNTMIRFCFGPKVAENCTDLVDELHQAELNAKFSFLKLLGNYGLPLGPNSQFSGLLTMIGGIIEKEVKRRAKEGKEDDYLQTLLDSNIDKEDRIFVASHIAHFILLSHSGVVSTVGWTSYHLLKDDKLYKKVEKELKANIYKTLTNCIVETSRRYGAMNLYGVFKDKATMGGFDFKRNESLFVSPASVNLNEEYYDEPLEYDPDRWSKKNPENSKKKGQLVTFNGTLYETHCEKFVNQLATHIFIPLLFDLGTKLTTTQAEEDVRPNYFSTESNPWSKCAVSFVANPQTKKNQ